MTNYAILITAVLYLLLRALVPALLKGREVRATRNTPDLIARVRRQQRELRRLP